MSALSLADALKDFGASPACSAEPFSVAATHFPMEPAGFPDFPAMAQPEPVDVDAIVAEAVARAEEALSERLAAEHAEALRAEQQRHADEMAELQQRFAEAATGKIASGFAEMEERLAASTSTVTARILGTMLSDDLRDRSIDRLVALIGEALSDGEAVRVRIHGSLPLFETLKRKMPGRASQFDFMESPDFDLSVIIDDSIYETRLAEWSAALAETLA